MQLSKVHKVFTAREMGRVTGYSPNTHGVLESYGIGLDSSTVENMQVTMKAAMKGTMDELQPTVTTGSISTPVQFLQKWLPGFVFVATAPRQIDEFTGIQITGEWYEEQVVQQVLERVGKAQPYQDWTNVNLASWNTNQVIRTVVRFEEGMRVTPLQSGRAARMLVDDAGAKRESCALSLDIERNDVGFYGFNAGSNNTYGFLNAPELSPYTIVPTGASGQTFWSTKTLLEIIKDLQTAAQELRIISKGVVNPGKDPITIAVANSAVQWLSTPSDFGYSVKEWLSKNMSNVRIVEAPQLDNAHSNQNVFYMYAERVDDMSTDGGAVWVQPVPARFKVLGVQQMAKGYEESYTNATAGVMCKRPYAVVRFYGI